MTTPPSLIWTVNILLGLTGLFSTVSCGQRKREGEEVVISKRQIELTVRWDSVRWFRSNLMFTQ